jgi:hypothetical protein
LPYERGKEDTGQGHSGGTSAVTGFALSLLGFALGPVEAPCESTGKAGEGRFVWYLRDIFCNN